MLQTLQSKRVAVFTACVALISFATVNLVKGLINSFSWANVLDVLVLLPSILAAALLVRVWVRQSRRHKAWNERKRRESISGGYVMPKND